MNKNNNNLFKIKIQIRKNFYIGPGKVALLESIVTHGSISSAAKSMGMSYRKAWSLIKEINDASLKRMIITNTGGKGIRGTKLSSEGKKFISSFRRIENKLIKEVQKEKKYLYKIFNE